MKATLELFWDDAVSRTENLDDRYALSCARLSALVGGHAIVTLSSGLRAEYLSDDTESVGYRLTIDGDAPRMAQGLRPGRSYRMKRNPLLSDEMVELRLQQHEKLQYLLTPPCPSWGAWQAEIIGPEWSEFFGRSAFGSDKEKAVSNLVGQLARNGFIGRLVEGPIRQLSVGKCLLGQIFSDLERRVL